MLCEDIFIEFFGEWFKRFTTENQHKLQGFRTKNPESGLKVSDVGARGDHCVVTLTFGQRMSSQDGCGSDNKVKQKVVNLRENRKPTATMWLLFYLTGGFA